ncbi:MAG: molybdate ABC transporter substrate-binding protein [Woeseiaceae bacterium]|nr:molybdate ABC transporter substrate-binding protein [Woeseiaceae bacterium]
MRRLLAIITATGLIGTQDATASDDVLIAVASNFVPTATELVERFNETTDYRATLSSGSTGKLYAQIVNGAPYDVFLSADASRPALLEQQGQAVPDSRFTYAVGALLLWARNVDGGGDTCIDAFLDDRSSRISIANPKIAPYGAAAQEYLQQAGLWEDAVDRLIIGENISQTLQFVSAGGASFGFIAAAQAPFISPNACLWEVPTTLYAPIRQQAVLLSRSRDSEAANAFMSFLRGDGQAIVVDRGYTSETISE